jgi:hypothetical protein
MTRELILEKPINKMTRLEVMRFIDRIAPELHYFPKTTYGGRGLAETLYEKYIAGEEMPVSRYDVSRFK